jgi:uncharacterized protein RhaS with RHS repeats
MTTYDFDAFGNRTEMDISGNATTYAYDDADRITTVTPPSPASAISYTWDDNGNVTDRGSDSFAWDYEDRMVSATVNSVTTTLAYRGDGLRDSLTVGMTTTTFTLGYRRRAAGGPGRWQSVRLRRRACPLLALRAL